MMVVHNNTLSLVFVLCLLCVFVNAQSTCPHWSYDDDEGNGPTSWATLCDAYSTCNSTDNSRQSPIDLSSSMQIFFGTKNLTVTYEQIYNATFLNNGHTVQVVNNDPNNALTFTLPFTNSSYTNVGSTSTTNTSLPYTLAQFHFHSPSEHTYQNSNLPLELHLVHRNTNLGTIAVLAFLFNDGDPHPFLTHLEEKLADIANSSETTIIPSLDMSLILDGSFPFYHYPGSLTTPPCTENVDWFIHSMVLTASIDQISRLSQILGRDSRPVQPLNGRIVQSFILDTVNGTFVPNGTLINNGTLLNNNNNTSTQINNTTTTTTSQSTTTASGSATSSTVTTSSSSSSINTGGANSNPNVPPLPNPYPLPPTAITSPTAKTSGGAVAAILLSILVALVFLGLLSRDLLTWYQRIFPTTTAPTTTTQIPHPINA